jgi:hypothetical protein
MALPPIDFPTLGWQVADWIEAMLCHGPGDVQGDRLVLSDERVLFLCWAYRLFPKGHKREGQRAVHHAVLSRAKGWAKSEFAGEIACAEALGPVRFDGWDANGDPVGVPVKYPFIRCMATEEEQSGNTYDNVKFMLEEGEVANCYALDTHATKTFIREPGGGEIVPSTSGDASKDGGKESFAVGDETHLYVTDQLRRMYRTVARNTGKRSGAEPWMLDTTTAWQPGERSIAEMTFDKHGEAAPDESVIKRGVLIDHLQGPTPKIFGRDASLVKAIKVAYGDEAGRMDYDRIVNIVRDAEDPESEAHRYFLNRPRVGVSQWLAPDEIKPVLGEVNVVKDQMVTLGFDGSENDDHTALFGCTEDGDLFTIGAWTPDGDSVDWRLEVDETVRWAFHHFKVQRFYGDPPYWIEEMAKWSKEFGRKKVFEFWTSVDAKMGVATGALRSAIRQKQITIDPTPLRTEPLERNGKPLVQWHFENARTRKVKIKLDDKAQEAFIVRKEKPSSDLKIDSVPAAVLARRARDDEIKLGGFKVRKAPKLHTF